MTITFCHDLLVSRPNLYPVSYPFPTRNYFILSYNRIATTYSAPKHLPTFLCFSLASTISLNWQNFYSKKRGKSSVVWRSQREIHCLVQKQISMWPCLNWWVSVTLQHEKLFKKGEGHIDLYVNFPANLPTWLIRNWVMLLGFVILILTVWKPPSQGKWDHHSCVHAVIEPKVLCTRSKHGIIHSSSSPNTIHSRYILAQGPPADCSWPLGCSCTNPPNSLRCPDANML